MPPSNKPESSFALPPQAVFDELGVTIRSEMPGGHQSRVLLVTEAQGEHASQSPPWLVLKLVDATAVDRKQAIERLRVRDRVARRDDRVVPIWPLAGAKVNRVGNCLGVASPFIEGRQLDVANRSDVERMGRALARLHQSLSLVSADLPVVAPLRAGEPVEGLLANHQLLHGDFDVSNLVLDRDGRLWVLDFDDCGYGPVEFELGNTLFMTLFDTSPSLNQPSETFRNFRSWFLGAYQASAERQISELVVDLALQARSDALRFWLHNLEQAPIGIRTASPEWHRHLRAFAGIGNR